MIFDVHEFISGKKVRRVLKKCKVQKGYLYHGLGFRVVLRVLENCAAMHDCTVEVKLMGAAESLTSDLPLCERIADVCANHLGMKVSKNLSIKLGGSEDFSYMMNRVQSHGGQAVFMRVRSPLAAGAHNRKFDFDESYMAKAVKVFCGVAYDLMK